MTNVQVVRPIVQPKIFEGCRIAFYKEKNLIDVVLTSDAFDYFNYTGPIGLRRVGNVFIVEPTQDANPHKQCHFGIDQATNCWCARVGRIDPNTAMGLPEFGRSPVEAKVSPSRVELKLDLEKLISRRKREAGQQQERLSLSSPPINQARDVFLAHLKHTLRAVNSIEENSDYRLAQIGGRWAFTINIVDEGE